MSRAVITAKPDENEYIVKIAGYEQTFAAQCVTFDILTVGTEVETVDIDNQPPHKAMNFGPLRLLPNTGEYTYEPEVKWHSYEEFEKNLATLAKSFIYSSELNPRWQIECPMYRRGQVDEIIDDKYMMVRVTSMQLAEGLYGTGMRCRTDYMTCDTLTFSVGDQVVIKFEDSCVEKPVVVGFWNTPKGCHGIKMTMWRDFDDEKVNEDNDYYVTWEFYRASNGYKIKTVNTNHEDVTIEDNLYTIDTSTWADLGRDPNGYYCRFKIGDMPANPPPDGVYDDWVEYELVYKASEYTDHIGSTAMQVGKEDPYRVIVPYFLEGDWEYSGLTNTNIPLASMYSYGCNGTGGHFKNEHVVDDRINTHFSIGIGASIQLKKNVKSTIPFKVLGSLAIEDIDSFRFAKRDEFYNLQDCDYSPICDPVPLRFYPGTVVVSSNYSPTVTELYQQGFYQPFLAEDVYFEADTEAGMDVITTVQNASPSESEDTCWDDVDGLVPYTMSIPGNFIWCPDGREFVQYTFFVDFEEDE
jgi:hypothetical protein